MKRKKELEILIETLSKRIKYCINTLDLENVEAATANEISQSGDMLNDFEYLVDIITELQAYLQEYKPMRKS